MKKRTYLLTLLSFFLLSSAFAGDINLLHQSFYGHWLLKKYALDILASKSIYNVTSGVGITEFIITPQLKDSMWVSFNNAEAGKYPFTFVDDQTVVLRVSKKETYQLKLITNGQNKTELSVSGVNGYNENFVFLPGTHQSFNSVARLVNQKLISGSYATAVQMGMRMRGPSTENVKFLPNGQVTGISGFDRYEVITELSDMADFDLIRMVNSQTGDVIYKGWESKNNKLVLYDLSEGNFYQFKKDKVFLQLSR